MRLKEIKPGMVIHCKTKEEMEQLLEHLNAETKDDNLWDRHDSFGRTDCIRIGGDGLYCSFSSIGFYRNLGDKIAEFSDLIIPSLSPEEVLETFGTICSEYYEAECKDCPMRKDDECMFDRLSNPNAAKEVVKICEQWKADHEKKEPEIEWSYFTEVHGEKFDSMRYFDAEEDARAFVEATVKENPGAYGKYERICRVKQQESV